MSVRIVAFIAATIATVGTTASPIGKAKLAAPRG
jgi:hypothetical protein